MSLFGECTLRNITAEYVEEKLAMENVADISVSDDDDTFVDESGYIDALLEALEEN